MKTEINEEVFVKWVDGDLSAEELVVVDCLMAGDEVFREEMEAAKRLSGMVRENVPASIEPPYGDFFNSQLMRKVDLAAERKEMVRSGKRWWESIRWSWVPVGALALAVSFLAGNRLARPVSGDEIVGGTITRDLLSSTVIYAAGNDLEAQIIADASGEISAIVVNGLSALSDDVDFQTASRSSESSKVPVSYRESEKKRFY